MADAIDGQQLAYELHLPAGPAPAEGWPLLLFLHGAGERGDDLARVAVHGPPRLVATRPALWGCVLVAPQCPADGWWQSSTLVALLDEVTAALATEAPIDPRRVHVTGLSMGGFGTFELLATHPQRFASALAICGGMRADRVDAIAAARDVPLRVVHGSADRVVPLSSSERVVARLRAAGADVEFTVLDGVDHDSWTATYADDATWAWLFAHRRAAGR
jgi:predicted peptidase